MTDKQQQAIAYVLGGLGCLHCGHLFISGFVSDPSRYLCIAYPY